MSVSVKVVFHKSDSQSDQGYLKLLRIKDRKKNYRSLGLPPLSQRYWDPIKQRVRKNSKVDYLSYNSSIERELSRVLEDPSMIQKDPSSKHSFLHYFERSINGDRLHLDHGTRLKYRSVLNKLKEYLDHIGRTDLPFSDLDLDFIESFQKFLRTSLTTNTTIHYHKVIRIFIRRSQKDPSIQTRFDPYTNFSFPKKEKVLKETLSVEDIQVIRNTPISNPRLDKVRNLFLFQYYTGGMRVSDLLTLRFKNLVNGRISYKMFKTKQSIDIPLTSVHIHLLHKLIDLKTDLNKPIQSFFDLKSGQIIFKTLKSNKTIEVPLLPKQVNQKTGVTSEPQTPDLDHSKPTIPPTIRNSRNRPSPISGRPPKVLLDQIPQSIYIPNQSTHGYNPMGLFISSLPYDELTKEISLLGNLIQNGGVIRHGKLTLDLRKQIDPINDTREVLSRLEKRKKDLDNQFVQSTIEELNKMGSKSKTMNSFVFDLLKNEEFPEPDLSILTEGQYLRINKTSIVYNRNLKELQSLLDLTVPMKSHLPRTSFTNIMMEEGFNTRDISLILGHSSLSITDNYVKSGFRNKRTDNIIEKLGQGKDEND